MKKLDAGYWMFLLGIGVFTVANLVGEFLAEFTLPEGLQPYAFLFVHIVEGIAAMAFAVIFLLILMKSANQGSTYPNPDPCVADINGDVRATMFMVILTTLMVGITIGAIFVPMLYIPGYSLWNEISENIKWSYGILTIFLSSMCFLRNYERRITVRVCLEAMYNIDTETRRHSDR